MAASTSAPKASSGQGPSEPAHLLATARDANLDMDASVPVLATPQKRWRPSRRGDLARVIVLATALGAVLVLGVNLTNAAQVADFSVRNLAPSLAHPFGTDWLGRDMLCRTLAGLSLSVTLGLLAAVLAAAVSLGLGCAAALGGPRINALISGAINVVMGLPHMVLLLLISFALGKGFLGVAMAIALSEWPRLARVVRAETLQCMRAPYVALAQHLGQTAFAVARRHLVPAVAPQLLVGLVLLFPHAIIHEASLTFLGFGLPPEVAAIGAILSESMAYLSGGFWWLVVFPGGALVASVLAFDILGRSLARLCAKEVE